MTAPISSNGERWDALLGLPESESADRWTARVVLDVALSQLGPARARCEQALDALQQAADHARRAREELEWWTSAAEAAVRRVVGAGGCIDENDRHRLGTLPAHPGDDAELSTEEDFARMESVAADLEATGRGREAARVRASIERERGRAA
jgi:hypothetical protein